MKVKVWIDLGDKFDEAFVEECKRDVPEGFITIDSWFLQTWDEEPAFYLFEVAE